MALVSTYLRIVPIKFWTIIIIWHLFQEQKSISRALVDTFAVSVSIFKDITALLAACIGVLGFTGPL